MSVHSLHPAGLRAHFQLYRTVMRGTRGLPAVDREMVALVVSRLNQCLY
jgi:alkylhydroperoxidase family enzyme